MANPRLRGTQSMLGTVTRCLRTPSLLLIEVAWRWVVGIPTLWLLVRAGEKILAETPLEQTGIAQFSLLDQTRSTQEVVRCVELLLPPVVHAAAWIVPLLIVLWSVASGIGRLFVIARVMKIAVPAQRIGTTIIIQFARIVGLTVTVLLWFWSLRGVGQWAILTPMQAADGEPNLVAYLGSLIALTIVALTLWAVVSWIFNAALIAAVAENRGVLSSISIAMHLGWLRARLVEVNLMLTVIKLALVVLAMVFSATPLPFETDMTGQSLHMWWLGVFVWYMVASDFYHVVRSATYADFWMIWRADIDQNATAQNPAPAK
jgi:hypothetical protein